MALPKPKRPLTDEEARKLLKAAKKDNLVQKKVDPHLINKKQWVPKR